MHKPHTIINSDPPWNLMAQDAHFIAYGLGWFLHDYHGRKIVEHGGNIDGMSALVSMVPEEKFGMVILTNLHGSFLPVALEYRLIDAFLNRPPKDWSATILKAFRALEAQRKEAEKKQIEARAKETRPSLPLEKYAGTYQGEMYGDLTMTLEDGKLVARYGQGFTGDLDHWHDDTFQSKWRNRMLGKGMISFALNAQGQVGEVKVTASAISGARPTRPRPSPASPVRPT